MPTPRSPYPNGRAKYTKEFLDELADDMLDIISADDTILYPRTFFTAQRLRYDYVCNWVKVSEKFKDAYELCQQICSDRIQMASLKNQINAQHVQRFVCFFDRTVAKAVREYKRELLDDQIEAAKKADLPPECKKIILEINEK